MGPAPRPKSGLPDFPWPPALRSQSWLAFLTPPHVSSAHPSAHGDVLRPYEPSPETARALLARPSPSGKKHILVLSELRTEDAGEVRFQAGPAQSVAQLEVEGKRLFGGGQEWASPSLGLAGWQLVQGTLPPPPPFLGQVTGGSAFPEEEMGRRRL